jgi:hypothetical protein
VAGCKFTAEGWVSIITDSLRRGCSSAKFVRLCRIGSHRAKGTFSRALCGEASILKEKTHFRLAARAFYANRRVMTEGLILSLLPYEI